MTEHWLPVVGYEGRYEVSSLGRVRSLPTNHPRTGVTLRPKPKRRGYLTVTLHGRGKPRTAQVHALVCEAFHGPKPAGCEVRHADGVSHHNEASNLAWGTHQENADDAKAHGVIVRGERHPGSTITDAQVEEMRQLAREGALTLKQIGARYGTSKSYAWKLVSGYRRGPARWMRPANRDTSGIAACRRFEAGH